MERKNYGKCTECKHWKRYYQCLMNDEEIPNPCDKCNPFDPEDDRERPMLEFNNLIIDIKIEEVVLNGLYKEYNDFRVVSDVRIIRKIAEKCLELSNESKEEYDEINSKYYKNMIRNICVVEITTKALIRQLLSIDDEEYDEDELNDFWVLDGLYYRCHGDNLETPKYLVRFSTPYNYGYNLLFNEDLSLAEDFMSVSFGYPYNGPAYTGCLCTEDIENVKNWVRETADDLDDIMKNNIKDPLWF